MDEMGVQVYMFQHKGAQPVSLRLAFLHLLFLACVLQQCISSHDACMDEMGVQVYVTACALSLCEVHFRACMHACSAWAGLVIVACMLRLCVRHTWCLLHACIVLGLITCHGFQACMVPSSLCILAFDQGSELVCRHLRVVAIMMCRELQHVCLVCVSCHDDKSVCQMQVDRSSRRCCHALSWM
jgi:hypothetical protein